MVFEQVKDIIVETLNCDADAVTPEAKLREDLDADSLDATELIMNLEERFGMAISDEESQKLSTVQEIVDYIVAHQ